MKELSIEQKAKRYDESLEQLKGLIENTREDKYAIVEKDIINIFPELKEPEDEKVKRIIHSISNKISFHLHDIFTEEEFQCFDAWSNAWLKKQDKPKWTDEDEERLQSCIIAIQGKGLMGGVDTMDSKWLKSLKQKIHDSSAKTCKNDTLLDLLQKMPSCITVDGIDYHFVMKKTSIYLAYYACYKGNGEEGRGNAIFGITAHSPIDLLTEMLEILKEKGLLEGGQYE